jgi:hypothetical protein
VLSAHFFPSLPRPLSFPLNVDARPFDWPIIADLAFAFASVQTLNANSMNMTLPFYS